MHTNTQTHIPLHAADPQPPPKQQTKVTMPFAFNFSFSFSLSLGTPPKNHNSHRHQHAIADVERDIHTPSPKKHQLEAATLVKESVVASTVKPELPESVVEVSPSTETIDVQIPDNPRSKAMDRESLRILLSTTEHSKRQTVTTPPSEIDTPDQHSDSSLVQISPIVVSRTLLDDPFTFSPTLPVGDNDDSGSDLVSSLQRLRVGGLASYFQKLDERASVAALASPRDHMSTEQDASERGRARTRAD